jgi:hypothetical protein
VKLIGRRRLALAVPLLFACFAGVSAATGAVSIAGATVEGANLWVDPSGGSCARQAKSGLFVRGQACASPAAAYNAAAAGDVVIVRAGSYGRQVFPAGTKQVTIRNASGARPVFGTTKVDAGNVTLMGVKIERTDDPGAYVATLEANGVGNTFDGVDVDSKFMETPGTTLGRQGILITGDRSTFKNGSTYNVVDEKGALVGASHVTFDNFDFHDVRATHELVHNECVFSLGPYLTVRNSHFWNCATMDLFIERGSWWDQPVYCCVTLENNVFEHTTSVDPGSWHHYSLGIHGGDMQELRNWRVVNNTFETAVSGGGTPAPGTIWANNLGGWSCFPGATFVNNVGEKCSQSDRAISPPSSCAPPACSLRVAAAYGWADPAAHDFRLRRGSPAINSGDRSRAPAMDNDGYRRPLGAAPDAGAYEYGTGIFVLGDASSRLDAAMRAFAERNGANLAVRLGSGRGTGLRGVAVTSASGSYGVRRMRDAEVIVLNSTAVTSAQTRWLQQTLARPATAPRIVVLRHPPYSCGAYLGSAAVRSQWVPLFRRYGVRLVLGGHDHNYQRFAAGRLTYVVSGGGASRPAALRSCPGSYPRRRVGKLSQSFVHLTVDETGIRGVAVDSAGKTIDRFVVR